MRGTTRIAIAVAFAAVAVSAAAAFGGSGSDSTDNHSTSVDRLASHKDHDARDRRHKRARHECGAHFGERGIRFVHGELKFQRDDGFVTRTMDQGKVTAVNADAKTITIRRADGHSVSAKGSDETRVCRNGERSTFGAIRVGDVARILQRTLDGKTELRGIAARSSSEAQTERTAA
jgi:uncharacterized protein YqfB (UPF0267 family)